MGTATGRIKSVLFMLNSECGKAHIKKELDWSTLKTAINRAAVFESVMLGMEHEMRLAGFAPNEGAYQLIRAEKKKSNPGALT